MKKQLLTLSAAIVLFSGYNTHAQDVRKGFVGIGLGATIPLGEFAETNVDKDESGFAKTGVLFDINFGYKFSEVVGAMVLLRSQAHAFDAQALADEYAKERFGSTIEVEADPWSTGSLMVGPFVSFPLSTDNKVAFDARALLGTSSTRHPEIEVTSDGEKFKFKSATGSSFAWMVGTGLSFNLSGRLGLGVHVDYFSSNPEIETEVVSPVFGSVKEKEKYAVNAVNTTFSIGYRFN